LAPDQQSGTAVRSNAGLINGLIKPVGPLNLYMLGGLILATGLYLVAYVFLVLSAALRSSIHTWRKHRASVAPDLSKRWCLSSFPPLRHRWSPLDSWWSSPRLACFRYLS
jgi:hypothetical protein